MMQHIRKNIETIKANIAAAAVRSGRAPEDVTLLVVTKMHEVDEIRAVLECGITDIGENRVQEAERKRPELGGGFNFHLIGHLQTNKARLAMRLFDVVQSVDSTHLAEKLDAEAAAAGKNIPVLLEVNSSGEESKFGVEPGDALATARRIAEYEHLDLQGLMTIGPLTADLDAIRKAFQETKKLFDTIAGVLPIRTLSMGMTDDYELAIEEGSTMVRVGRAVFERR
jgi:PLP dependent protein